MTYIQAYMEHERGLSRNTLESYRSDLLQFGTFLDRRGLGVQEAQHGDLAAFISELAQPAARAPSIAAGPGAERPPAPGRRGAAPAPLGRKAAGLPPFYSHPRPH